MHSSCFTTFPMNITRRFSVPALLLLMFSAAFAQPGNSRHYLAQPVGRHASGFFEENIGQVRDTEGKSREDIRFMVSRGDTRIYLRKRGLSYVFARPATPANVSRPAGAPIDASSEAEVPSPVLDLYRLDLQLIGANPDAVIVAGAQAPGYSTYHLSHLALNGARARNYSSITYRDIYPGIDMLVTRLEAGLKYEFHVHPGADPSLIRLRYAGADHTGIKDGGLVVKHGFGELREKRPYIHQENRKVDGGFNLHGDTVSFTYGTYDARKTLVIDPEVTWSLILGSSSTDVAFAAAYSRDGAMIVTGFTAGTDFPVTPGAVREQSKGGDAFIAVFRPDGSQWWTTYIGGNSEEVGTGIAIDSSDNIVVIGETASFDFPLTPGTFQSAASGVFVVKLRPDGALLWSSRYGGGLNERGLGVEVGPDGSVFVGGYTHSHDFPVTQDAFKTTFGPGSLSEGFLYKLDADGRRIWGTLLGGDDKDKVTAMGVLPDGDIVITGEYSSANLPAAPGAFQSTKPGDIDAFLARFSGDGRLRWATYFGGADLDDSYALDIDSDGHIIIAGETTSSNLPVSSGAAQPSSSIDRNGFVASFTTAGMYLWSTYLGASGVDACLGITALPCGAGLMVCGVTRSSDFPITPNGLMQSHQGDNDAFITQLDAEGRRILWSTLYGGARSDYAYGVSAYKDGRFIMAGVVEKMEPLPGGSRLGPPDRHSWTGRDAFMVEWHCSTPGTITASGPLDLCDGQSVTLDAGPGLQSYLWSTGETTRTITITQPGRYSVRGSGITDCCLSEASVDVRAKLDAPAEVTISCGCDSVTLDAGPGLRSYLWSTGETSQSITIEKAGRYSLTTVDANGCVGIWEENVGLIPSPENITLSPGYLEAAPGEYITMMLSPPEGSPGIICAEHLSATIRFNATLLAPTYIERGSIINDRTENGERFLTIVSADTGAAQGVLLEFIAALGDAESTTLVLDGFGDGNCPGRDSSRVLGEFRLRGICYEGGTRFFLGAGSTTLKPGRPNPASGITEIEFSVAESGRTSLVMFDMLGRAVMTLADGELSAGNHIISLDVSGLSSGRYHCVLATPTQTLSEVLVVEK